MLRIIMKDGSVRTYKGDAFTDYDWRKEAFIVIRDCQWIGIFNWDCVAEVLFMREEDAQDTV